MSEPDKPRPKASARRKRIVESVITEPIRPLPPLPPPQTITQPTAGPSTAGAASTSTSSSTRFNRPRTRQRGESSVNHTSDYSLEVQPITTAAIDRKDKYPVNARVLEIAGKVSVFGEVQGIKCFGCIEDEQKRQNALDEYAQLVQSGQPSSLT